MTKGIDIMMEIYWLLAVKLMHTFEDERQYGSKS